MNDASLTLDDQMVLQGIDLTHRFSRQHDEKTIFTDVGLHLKRGEKVLITGPSGSGKTTLLHVLSGQLKPQKGRVLLLGQSLYEISSRQMQFLRSKKMAVVFQTPTWLDDYNVLENIAMPLLISGVWHHDAMAKARRLATTFGLKDVLYESCPSLSGGERARMAFARALIIDPEIIFADEPTGALDISMAKMLWKDVFAHYTSCSMFVVSHDVFLGQWMNRVISFADLCI